MGEEEGRKAAPLPKESRCRACDATGSLSFHQHPLPFLMIGTVVPTGSLARVGQVLLPQPCAGVGERREGGMRLCQGVFWLAGCAVLGSWLSMG